MATPTKTQKAPNPFPGVDGGFMMSPKAALQLWKEGKTSGLHQYLLIEYILAETVSAEGRPKWLAGKKATAAVIAESLGFSVTCTEEALTDAAKRGLIARKKVGRAWEYRVAWENWKDVPQYEAKKPAVAKAAAEVPELRDAKQFVAMPGKFRHPVTLSEVVGKLDLAGEAPHGLRFEYGIEAGTLRLNVFGSEEAVKNTPGAHGALPDLTPLESVNTFKKRPKLARSGETPPDELEAWAQAFPARHIRVPVGAKQLRRTRVELGDAPVPWLAQRFELRKHKYTSHGMLPGLARDVFKAWQQSKPVFDPAQVEEVRRLLSAGYGHGRVIEMMRISKDQFSVLLTQIEQARGAGGEL